MKPLAIAMAALLALQPQAGKAAQGAPSEALIDRLIAVLPEAERKAMNSVEIEMDPDELGALIALNPGREAQVRSIMKADLPCFVKATSGLKLRIFRTAARDLGEPTLRRLIGFFEAPDYAASAALLARMDETAAPSPDDEAAMAKLMEAYPLQAWQDALSRSGETIAADGRFSGAILKCASKRTAALEAAGLKSH